MDCLSDGLIFLSPQTNGYIRLCFSSINMVILLFRSLVALVLFFVSRFEFSHNVECDCISS